MYRRMSQGFALPTIVISSVILFAVLVATMSVTSSAKTALDTQYYMAIASDAAEAGVLHGSTCLVNNNNVSPWGSNKLFPNSACNGAASCAAPTSCPLVSTSAYVTSYTVEPVANGGSGAQTAKVTGTASLKSVSSGTIWKTYTKVFYMAAGANVSATQIAFGYVGGDTGGAFFGVVTADGKMRTTGYNNYGQLGNGTTSTAVAAALFTVPTSSPIVAGFTNFLSVGYDLFGLTADGNLYGAGSNMYGELGNGSIITTSPNPARVSLPPGVKVRSVAVGYGTNYFIATNNNVYAAGACQYGMLGSGYAVSGCSDQSLPVRVSLPTPDLSDANTIPTNEIVSDRYTTYIRMAGGRVYGWGVNDRGQLGNDSFGSSSTPIKIGTFGDTSATKATQLSYDGETASILDDQGKVYSVGGNNYGTMGSITTKLRMPKATEAADCVKGTATTVALATCSNVTAQSWQLRSDSTVYNPTLNVCLTTSDGTALATAACNTTTNQKFTWNVNNSIQGTLVSQYNSRCVTNSSGTTMTLATCSGASAQYVQMYNSTPVQFNIASTVAEIVSDQWSLSVRTDTGEVWSSGINVSGQFGNGTTATSQLTPVKFALPSGVKAADIYETSGGGATDRQNLLVVGNNGKVYGAGSNDYGQLGNGTMSTSPTSTPVEMLIINGTSIVAKNVLSGWGTTVVITNDGKVYTVGNNAFGQLGDGTTMNRSTPVMAKYTNNFSGSIY